MCASYSAFHVADFEGEFSCGGFAESLKPSTATLTLVFELDLVFTYVNSELTSVKARGLKQMPAGIWKEGK